MPAPRWVARANRIGFNRLTMLVAHRAPGFGVVVHRGRKSGQTYRTPVNVFRRGNGYVISLTYGPESDWVRNVLTAGGCELETRGHRVELGAPRLYQDKSARDMPAFVRFILRNVVKAPDFLALEPVRSPSFAAPTLGRPT